MQPDPTDQKPSAPQAKRIYPPFNRSSASLREVLIHDILNSLIAENTEQIVELYTTNKHTEVYSCGDFFKTLVQLLNFFDTDACQQKLIKETLQRLLTIQQDKILYLQLIPKEIFCQIKKFNPITFERKLKKAEAKKELALISNYEIQHNTKGFAQLTLQLCTYFNDQNLKLEQVWLNIQNLVGKFQIDSFKINQILVDLLPSISSDQKLYEVIKKFYSENFLNLIVSRMFGNPKKETLIKFCGTIPELMFKEDDELFGLLQPQFNFKYLRTFNTILGNQQMRKDFQKFFTQSGLLLVTRQREIMIQLGQILEKPLEKQIAEASASLQTHQRMKNRRNQLLHGQLIGSSQFILMNQKLKSNQFPAFRKLYDQLIPQKITITLSVPLIKTFCKIIQWMVDPFLEKYSERRFFKDCKASSQLSFKSFKPGYFRQIKHVTLDFMKQLEQIFYYLDIYVGFCLTTFSKICKVFQTLLSDEDNLKGIRNGNEIKKKIENIIQNYLIGAISLSDENPVPSIRLSELIKLMPQKTRFDMYSAYMKDVMFVNLHLAHTFQMIGKAQDSYLSRLQFNPSAQQLDPLLRIQRSHTFQSLYKLSKMMLNRFFDTFTLSIVYVIWHSPWITRDLMLHCCLQTLRNNEHALMKNYDLIDDSYRVIINFLYQLYRKDKDLQLDVFFQVALARLKQKIPQPPATSMIVPHYNKSFYFLKLISSMLEKISPIVTDAVITNKQDRYEYFALGYFMRLQVSQKMQQYKRYMIFRKNFYKTLIKTYEKEDRPFILAFLSALNVHLTLLNRYYPRHQQDGSKTLNKHGKAIDQCIAAANHLVKIISIEECRLYRQPMQRPIIRLSVIERDRVFELMASGHIQFASGCNYLRQLHRVDFEGNKNFQFKKKWSIALKRYADLPKKSQQLRYLIDSARVWAFLTSSFFFNFWLSSMKHIYPLETLYIQKMDELSAKKKDKTITQQQAQQLAFTTKLIDEEKSDSAYGYQFFHKNNVLGQPPKMQVPKDFSAFLAKDRHKTAGYERQAEQNFKQFMNLFFTYCLLPRMVIDPCEAYFCSRYVSKVIKQNKFPERKCFQTIFTCVQAAVGYVQFATEKQASICLPIFVNDLLKSFKNWDKVEVFSAKILTELGIQKLIGNNYNIILKRFLSSFTKNFTANLTVLNDEPYICRNILLFLDKSQNIPLTLEQAEELRSYLKKVQQKLSNHLSINALCQKIQTNLKNKMETLPSLDLLTTREKSKTESTTVKEEIQRPASLMKPTVTEKEVQFFSSLQKKKTQKERVVIDLEATQKPPSKSSKEPIVKIQPKKSGQGRL